MVSQPSLLNLCHACQRLTVTIDQPLGDLKELENLV